MTDPTARGPFPLLIAALAVVFATTGATRVRARATPGAATGPAKVMTAVYLVPADRQEKRAYREAIEHALTYARAWYWRQLRQSDGGSRTFRIDPDGVRVVPTARAAAAYARARGGRETYATSFFYNVAEDATKGGVDLRDAEHVWVLLVDADPNCDQTASAALPGYAVLPGHHLHGLAGEVPTPLCPTEHPWTDVCRYVGTVAHESGHAFGLPHPPECPAHPDCAVDVMYWGRDLADARVILQETDRRTLSKHAFFVPTPPEDIPAVACASTR